MSALTHALAKLTGPQAHTVLRLVGVRVDDAHEWCGWCPCGHADEAETAGQERAA